MQRLLYFIKLVTGILASIVGLIVFVTFIFTNTSPQFGARPEGARLERITKSSNQTNGRFKNETPTDVSGKMDWRRSLGEYMTNGNKVPSWELPVLKVKPEHVLKTPDTITKVTWFGHSAILLEIDGKKVFLDPMLGDVPAPHPLLGSKRFNETLPIELEDIPPLDAVLISHDHYDHLDYDSILELKNKTKHFFVPLGVGAHLASWGVSEERITELDWWERTNLMGLEFIATPARHFSGRGFTDRAVTQWCSWVIKGKTHRIYFSGDSGYEAHFKEIGKRYGPFDLAIMECGQYDEQWPYIHMMPEETVQATLELQGEHMLPIHWGSFKLSLHSWEDPIERVTAEAQRKKVSVATPIIGETIVLGEEIPKSEWWVQE